MSINIRKKFFITVFTLIVTTFLIIFFYSNNNLMKNYELNYILQNNQNNDGGFHDIPNNLLYENDNLYFTYYSLLCLQYLDDNLIKKNSKRLTYSISHINIEKLLDSKYYDNLSNIYYYIEISKMLNLEINKDIQKQFKNYILKLQTEEGSFTLSNKQKNSKENMDLYLPTYYATNILDYLNINSYNKSQLCNWIISVC